MAEEAGDTLNLDELKIFQKSETGPPPARESRLNNRRRRSQVFLDPGDARVDAPEPQIARPSISAYRKVRERERKGSFIMSGPMVDPGDQRTELEPPLIGIVDVAQDASSINRARHHAPKRQSSLASAASGTAESGDSDGRDSPGAVAVGSGGASAASTSVKGAAPKPSKVESKEAEEIRSALASVQVVEGEKDEFDLLMEAMREQQAEEAAKAAADADTSTDDEEEKKGDGDDADKDVEAEKAAADANKPLSHALRDLLGGEAVMKEAATRAADDWRNDAVAAEERNDLKAALVGLQKACAALSPAALENEAGPEAVELGNALSALALLHREMDDAVGARECWRLSLRILDTARSALPEGQHETLKAQLTVTLGDTHELLAIALDEVAEFEKALTEYRNALGAYVAVYGDHHPNISESLANVGHSYRRLNDNRSALDVGYEPAIVLLREAIERFDREATASKSDEEPNERAILERQTLVQQSKETLGRLLTAKGDTLRELADFKGAELAYNEALDVKKELLGDMHPSVAETLSGLGQARAALKKYKEALQLIELSVKIRVKHFGETHTMIQDMRPKIDFLRHRMGLNPQWKPGTMTYETEEELRQDQKERLEQAERERKRKARAEKFKKAQEEAAKVK